ncbi:hypothetical protein FOXB_07678 [Fusarium oxysporum f. sp. conglutinans Fo5176]|uniref:Uncharacterized protein n=1 Tax=Fusarium oxysporum (strain Fo5176) TaxID=660025 RepID=F9FMP8_FUSOF|nr:hypothetical protein FOXB_07678 [Fusarium oxysporum f. sp. conglutinans Fo5176]
MKKSTRSAPGRNGLLKKFSTARLLGHYILDGQLSYLAGQPRAVTLHAIDTLRLSACSKAFKARDAQEWRRAMAKSNPKGLCSFSDIYHEIFTTKDTDSEISPFLRCVKASLDNREAQSLKLIVKILGLPDVNPLMRLSA